jgi:hypothetical protein
MHTSLSYPELLQALSRFADQLEEVLATAVPDWHLRPAADEWSLTEVMAHMRDVEREVHRPRYQAVIREDNPFIPGVSSDDWASARNYQAQDGRLALDAFLAARRANVALLRSLDPEYGERTGRHAYFGPTTLEELINLAVQHDAAHWEQIQALLQQDNG